MTPFSRKWSAVVRIRHLILASLLSAACLLGGTPIAPPMRAAERTNLIGMNTSSLTYWGPDKPLIDVIKLAEPWKTLSGGKPKIDADGWPLQDAQILVWADQTYMQGTYKLSFTGKAAVAMVWGSGHITNQTYDAATNVTRADVTCDTNEKSALQISFQKTSGGVKNVKLIRPGYADTETFTTPYKTALGKASVIRFMDFSNTVGNAEVNWSDRRLPSYYSQAALADGKKDGAAWEYMVQLANELKRDAWINVPALATDDYVKQLAKLWKDGDTVEGVTYPGLDPSLKLYVEYSNEVWNPGDGFDEHRQNQAAAVAEVRTGKSPLNYDGSTDDWVWGWRRTAKRIKEISDAFRSVFGDEAMLTRVRPILAAQHGTPDVGKQGLLFIDAVYGNLHPVSYYLYGFGGAPYYSPDVNSDKLSLDTLFATLLTPDWMKSVQAETDWATVYGLRHVAYEGGPSLDNTGHSEAVKAAAVKDPRMTTALINMHHAWTANGGELLNYYLVAWDYQWGFTDNISNLDTPKYRAIDALNRATPAPLTYGVVVPATINAEQWNISSRATTSHANAITLKPLVFNSGFNPESAYWTAYTIRADNAATYQISVAYFSRQAGQLKVIVDGTAVEMLSLQNTSGADQTSAPLNITLGVGLHAIRLQSVAGEFAIRSIQIKAGAS